jgi:hypothetical protein
MDKDIVSASGDTVMGGEYAGCAPSSRSCSGTGVETNGTYGSLAERARRRRVGGRDLSAYRKRNGIDLDIDQALIIRIENGRWKEVTAGRSTPFDAFWA